MLPKAQRLSGKDVQYLFKRGKRFRAAFFDVVYLPNRPFRCGVAIRKKDTKLANDRNRLRRQVYGLVEERMRESGLPPVRCFLVAKQPNTVYSSRVAKQEIEQFWRRVTNINPSHI